MLHEIVLGLVQGLTEFLPVSSSGHLVVVPGVLEWDEPGLSFDLMLHVGTLLAVLVAFRADLWQLALGVVGRGADPARARRLLVLLAAGSVPAGVVGLLLEDVFERMFAEPLWVTGFWLVTAAALLVSERAAERRVLARRPGPGAAAGGAGGGVGVAPGPPGLREAVLVGVAQAAAIAPGISRSGSTIAAGIVLGMTREEAARFSFLLSIPAIAGGGLTLVPEVASGRFELTGAVWAGFAVAAVSGWLAITGLLRLVRTRTLRPFAAYLVVVAPLAALALAVG